MRVIGLGIGPSEAETFWTEFLRSLRVRGLGGVRTGQQRRAYRPQSRHRRSFESNLATLSRPLDAQTPWPMSRVVSILCVARCHPTGPRSTPTAPMPGETWAQGSQSNCARAGQKLADLMDRSEHDVRA